MELQSLAGNNAPRSPAAAADKAVQALAETRASTPAAPVRAAEPAAPPEPPEPSAEQLSQAVKNINSALQARSQDLEFSVDADSARLVVTVTDKDTKEVIRQMPSKEAMEIAKALDHLQSLLIRQTA
jgi:flagellar protein FlaG